MKTSKRLYEAVVELQHCDSKEKKTKDYQVPAHNINHAFFLLGKRFHSEDWELVKIEVKPVNFFSKEEAISFEVEFD